MTDLNLRQHQRAGTLTRRHLARHGLAELWAWDGRGPWRCWPVDMQGRGVSDGYREWGEGSGYCWGGDGWGDGDGDGKGSGHAHNPISFAATEWVTLEGWTVEEWVEDQ